MDKPTLTEQDWQEAADKLRCEVAAIKAVTSVEAPKGAFLPDGRPTILFERHKFHKYSGGRFDQSHPDISSSKAGGYGPEGIHQWVRFTKAFDLDPKAAMMSTSWGRFQIMGFNYHLAGYESLDAFVEGMKESEADQLLGFVHFIEATGLADELRHHDWVGFARLYNGPEYTKNHYPEKMAAGYLKFKKTSLQKDPYVPPPRPVVGSSVIEHLELIKESIENEDLKKNEDKAENVIGDEPKDEVAGTPPPAPAQEIIASRPSLKSTAAAVITFLMAPFTLFGIDVKAFAGKAGEFAQANVLLTVKIAAVFGFVVLAVYVWNKAMERAHERTKIVMNAAADKDKNNLRLI